MAESQPTGAVVRGGYLFKEGGVVKSWKKRFFKLKDNKQINYYENEGSKKPLGVISLKNMYSIKPNSNIGTNFNMECATRTWKFRAENQAERNAWISAIQQVVSGNITRSNTTPGMQQNYAPASNPNYQQPQPSVQRPVGTGSNQVEGEASPVPAQTSSGAEGLPPGWTTGVDPGTGHTYYVNTIMKTTQWQRPVATPPGEAPPPSYQAVQIQPFVPPQNNFATQSNMQPVAPGMNNMQPAAPGMQPNNMQPVQPYQAPKPYQAAAAPGMQQNVQPKPNPYQAPPPGGWPVGNVNAPYQQYNQPVQQPPVAAPAHPNQQNYQQPPYNQQYQQPPNNQPNYQRPPPQQQQLPANAPAYPSLPQNLAPPPQYAGFTRFDEGTIGIEFVLRQNKFVLTIVRPRSPAANKGVRVGQQIESVYDGYGRPVQGSTAPQLAQQISYAPRPVHIKFANSNVVVVQRVYNPRPYHVYRRRHQYSTGAAIGAAVFGGAVMGAILGGPHHRHHHGRHRGWGRGHRGRGRRW